MQTPNILRAASLLMLVLCCPRPWCEAQKKIAPADYDYYALAITSIADITAEASKLSDIPQRARIMIQAARILQPAHGGNRDGVITPADGIFTSLRLWRDTNHNGISESSELSTLEAGGLKTLEVAYKTSKFVDQYGNSFRYRAKVKDTNGAQVGRWAWDVFLVTAQ